MTDATTLTDRPKSEATDGMGVPGGNILYTPESRRTAGRMSAIHCAVIGGIVALVAHRGSGIDAVTIGYLIALGAWTPVAAFFRWDRRSHNWISKVYFIGAGSFVFFAHHFDNPYLLLGMFPEIIVFADVYWYRRSLLAVHEGLLFGAFLASAVVIGGPPATALIAVAAPMMAISALIVGMASHRFIREQIQQSRFQTTITSLLEALQARDGYTGEHSRETLVMASAVAEQLGMDEEATKQLADVALLHDIGKIGIPNSILLKPGKLTPEEWDTMKQHPVIGEQILAEIPGFEIIAKAVRHEHERWDGNGYPDGISGEEIPLPSRIVLACDAFHAMTSDRPYRKAMPVDEARLELRGNAGTQFDPSVIAALEAAIDNGLLDALTATTATPGEMGIVGVEPVATRKAMVINIDGEMIEDRGITEVLAEETSNDAVSIVNPKTMALVSGLSWLVPALLLCAYLVANIGVDRTAWAIFALTILAGGAFFAMPTENTRIISNLVAGMGGYLVVPYATYHYNEPALLTLLLLPMLLISSRLWSNKLVGVIHSAAVVAMFGVLPVAMFGWEMLPFAAVALRSFPGVLLVVGFYLRLMVATHFEQGRFGAATSSLLLALQARDGYTGEHSDETLKMAMDVADELRLPEADRLELKDVALLHDIGKIGIPDEILHKPGSLDEDEWKVMCRHPEIGEQIVMQMPGFASVAKAIRHEHERWDGAGYPDGIAGESIPLASRIVLACDAFHAMTSDRPYRKAMSIQAARTELVNCAGSQFDPSIISALLSALDREDLSRSADDGAMRLTAAA